MAKRQVPASERARQARAATVICAYALLGIAVWLVLKHAIGKLVMLDAERTLTLETYLLAHAVALSAAAQPARALSRPLGVRLALVASLAATVNVTAAMFFAIDLALVWTALESSGGGPVWVLFFLVPTGVSLLLQFSSIGVPPEEPADISDDDLTEAALILTESQRRWSWEAIFAMAGYMALTRAAILAAYFGSVVNGIGIFEWLSRALFETSPMTWPQLWAAVLRALEQGAGILGQAWIWILFVLVAIVPPLFVLGTAAWYRWQVPRDRMRLRTVSQSSAARLMTNHEVLLLRRAERPFARKADPQRAVS